MINATGVVLHTNLGRRRERGALGSYLAVAQGFSTLEHDVATERCDTPHCTALHTELTEAEDACRNNCAAALVLALNTLAIRN